MQKKTFMPLSAALIAASLFAFSQSAFAHAHLKSSVPADNQETGRAPQSLTLNFSEGIEPAFSGVEVRDAKNKTVAHEKTEFDAKQGNRLTVPFAAPLKPGEYQVSWHVLSVDGHKTSGNYRFSVK